MSVNLALAAELVRSGFGRIAARVRRRRAWGFDQITDAQDGEDAPMTAPPLSFRLTRQQITRNANDRSADIMKTFTAAPDTHRSRTASPIGPHDAAGSLARGGGILRAGNASQERQGDRWAHRRHATFQIRSVGTILGVWAHPDDETYFSAGLMAMARQLGQRVVVATATAGEAGLGEAGSSPAALADVRRRELAASLDLVGVTEHHWLGHQDGGCDEVTVPRGAESVEQLISDVAPDTIVTFGPDGFTGHPDHRAVARWAAEAWRRSGRKARLLQTAVTHEFLQRHAVANDRFLWMPGADPVPVHPGELAIQVDCRGQLSELKLAALRAHASQTGPIENEIGTEAFRSWFQLESFVEAGASRRRSRSSKRRRRRLRHHGHGQRLLARAPDAAHTVRREDLPE